MLELADESVIQAETSDHQCGAEDMKHRLPSPGAPAPRKVRRAKTEIRRAQESENPAKGIWICVPHEEHQKTETGAAQSANQPQQADIKAHFLATFLSLLLRLGEGNSRLATSLGQDGGLA